MTLSSDISIVVYMWADQAGGWRSLCFKIGYSEPTRAESREGTSTVADSSRVTLYTILIGWWFGWRNTRIWLAAEWLNTRFWLADDSGDVLLDSDWLTTRIAEIRVYSAQCIKIGYSSAQCFKFGFLSPMY